MGKFGVLTTWCFHTNKYSVNNRVTLCAFSLNEFDLPILLLTGSVNYACVKLFYIVVNHSTFLDYMDMHVYICLGKYLIIWE